MNKFDIVVAGGGCAGICAAVSAARNGARVLLVERAGFCGGIITNVGLSYFDGITDATTDKIILRGLPLEFLVRMGICKGDATHLDQVPPERAVYKAGAITIRSIEEFKLVADQVLRECGDRLTVLYHSIVCETTVAGDRITHVAIANKDGLTRVAAEVFIDCSGDADLARFSGAKTERSEVLMPMTLHFRVANLPDSPELREAMARELKQAYADGALAAYYGPNLGYLFGKNEVTVHAVRIRGNGGSAADLSRAEMQGRADAWTMFDRWKKNIPQFADAYFLLSGPEIGVRETWRIQGVQTLTQEDILARREYDDGVATGTWYLDLHPNETTVGSANPTPPVWPGTYDIRYGTLLSPDLDNLLVAGRCHAATRIAASSSRVTCTAMVMGQAAGIAAAMAVQKKEPPRDLSGVAVSRHMEALELGPFRA